MAFLNRGFETEDSAELGFAEDWTTEFVFNGVAVAGYGDGSAAEAGDSPREAFEGGWDSNEDFLFAFQDPVDLSELFPAFYDDDLPSANQAVEDFEDGWSSNEAFLFTFGSSEAAVYDSGTPEAVEDFEEEWDSNEAFLNDWAEVVSGPGVDTAMYDSGSPEGVEDFEEEWDSNESFLNDWAEVVSGPGVDTAMFDLGVGGTPQAVEDFEEVNAEFVFTAEVISDKILKTTSHGLTNGQKVTFRNEGGELPGGINVATEYFVIGATATSFQISATSGGTKIDITDVGTGTHFSIPDPGVFWVQIMTTL